jgi:hypothetical protein
MKRLLFLSILLIALAAFVCAAGSSEAQRASKAGSSAEADRAAIATLWTNYSKDAMEGNFDAFLQLHDRDAYKMPQDQPMFQPWVVADTMRASWTKRVQVNTMQMSVVPKEIVLMGDYAYTMGTYTQALTPKTGGNTSVFDGKFLAVVHRNPGSKWQIYRACYNGNLPDEEMVSIE